MAFETIFANVILPLALLGAQDALADEPAGAGEEIVTEAEGSEEDTDIVVTGEVDPDHVVNCRLVRQAGSRIPRKICSTAAQDRELEKAAGWQLEEMLDAQRQRMMKEINRGGG